MPEQLEFFDIASPCRGICQTDDKGYCRGCLRSRQERFDWIKMNDSQKRDVLRLCHQRFLRSVRRKDRVQHELDDPHQPSLF